MENEIIIEEWSPVCNIQAFVERSSTTYYFYLWMNPESDAAEVHSCWVCNRIEAPEQVDFEAMEQGEAPCMPKQFVKHEQKGIELDESKLSLQWFEEGDAAALLMNNDIIAVIPCFSGYNDFYGYSIYAEGTGPFAWGLKDALSVFSEKVIKSKQFWNYFESDYWENIQQSHIETLEKLFGKYEKYFAIDGNKFPPKALIKGTRNDIVYGITAGVSMIPMPKVEMYYHDDSNNFRRIELGFACVKKHESITSMMYQTLSGLSTMPWSEITFLGHGHTIPYNNIKGFTALLFVNSRILPLERPKYSTSFGDAVNLLWVVPIVQDEYEYIVKNDIESFLEKVDITKIHIFNGKAVSRRGNQL